VGKPPPRLVYNGHLRCFTLKQPGRAADHSPASRAEVMNKWSYNSTLPYAFNTSTGRILLYFVLTGILPGHLLYHLYSLYKPIFKTTHTHTHTHTHTQGNKFIYFLISSYYCLHILIPLRCFVIIRPQRGCSRDWKRIAEGLSSKISHVSKYVFLRKYFNLPGVSRIVP
jgi:hypothetical protein